MSTDLLEKNEIKLQKPNDWNVILHNDDVTPMEFVVLLLMYVFNMSQQKAMDKMLAVHEGGSATVFTGPHEIAEQKYVEAMEVVNNAKQKLKISLEENK